MSIKFLRKATAKKCPIHKVVLDSVQDALVEVGYFSKDEILEGLDFTAVSESIRWDYIREFIQSDLDIELVPVVSRFFKAYVKDASGNRVKTSDERKIRPEKYLAQGNGKKTAGYCNITLDEGTLAVRRLAQKKAMTNGVGTAYLHFVKKLQERNLIDQDDVPRIGVAD